ncbi:MAG: bifunctional folylpolyglutamate synthase/dihydrofolate synthase, partial [Candidatus Kapabacteria bacterium]|nr:bifunctional folylpolyglutamate synthase/dihydrofolate synthase [Candidatus Kapabacteria bacterium]
MITNSQRERILEELYSFHRAGIQPGLHRTHLLLAELGNPEAKMKCIHVAGTNGKGSVCSMLASLFSEAGYKTGLYTSPHIMKFNERI